MKLEEKFRPHTRYWDCYNDEPLTYNHDKACVRIAEKFALGFLDYVQDSADRTTNKEMLRRYKELKFK